MGLEVCLDLHPGQDQDPDKHQGQVQDEPQESAAAVETKNTTLTGSLGPRKDRDSPEPQLPLPDLKYMEDLLKAAGTSSIRPRTDKTETSRSQQCTAAPTEGDKTIDDDVPREDPRPPRGPGAGRTTAA